MELTPNQRIALDELHQRVRQVPAEFLKEEELVKWLIARKFDVSKAESMILKSMKWREEWKIDSLLDWTPPEVLTKYCPTGVSGVDKDGYPVNIARSGSIDMRGILQSVSRRHFLLFNIQVLEKFQKLLAKQTKHFRKGPMFGLTVIIDLDNCSLEQSMWKPAMDCMREMTEMLESNYPEIMRKAYVINAPKIFAIIYAAMRPFMREETIEKMKFYGKTGWKEDLLEAIDPDQLPAYYGGTMTDADGNEKCLSKICWGGLVPKRYYHMVKYKDQLTKYEKIVVSSGRVECFHFTCKKSNSRLSWQIQTEEFDIGVGITFSNGSKEEIILPEMRVNAELYPEEGDLICSKEGVYTLTLNNQFSLFRAKTVHYLFTFEELSEFSNNDGNH